MVSYLANGSPSMQFIESTRYPKLRCLFNVMPKTIHTRRLGYIRIGKHHEVDRFQECHKVPSKYLIFSISGNLVEGGDS